jgi:hypothetical protein
MLDEIMPMKDFHGTKVRDFDNCKYREELLRAGIGPAHLHYAYTNRAEFIAVATEGDMSKYSPEFKDILIKLGMPEFAFNLKVIDENIQERARLKEFVQEKYPEEKDFDKLVDYAKKEKAKKRAREEKCNLLAKEVA